MDKRYLVAQDNKLIEARHNNPLSTREQKIILTMISMIQINDTDFKNYEISVKDFSKMLDLKGTVKYTEMKEITRNLMSKTIEFPEEDGWLLVNWLASARYLKGEGVISLSFSPDLKPYLLQLRDKFTSYRLSNILSLSSSYSIRLYELMKLWDYRGQCVYLLSDLRERLGANGKSYELYGNFKNRVLLPALKELNEKTDLHVEFEEMKKGRAVHKLKFLIKKVEEKEIKILDPFEIEQEKIKQVESDLRKKMNEKAIRNNQQYYISNSAFNRMHELAMKIYSNDVIDKELLLLVDYVNKASGKIKNPEGLMIHILTEMKRNYENGEDASIETLTQVPDESKSVIPSWFEKQRDGNTYQEKMDPDKEKELEERRKKLRKELGKRKV